MKVATKAVLALIAGLTAVASLAAAPSPVDADPRRLVKVENTHFSQAWLKPVAVSSWHRCEWGKKPHECGGITEHQSMKVCVGTEWEFGISGEIVEGLGLSVGQTSAHEVCNIWGSHIDCPLRTPGKKIRIEAHVRSIHGEHRSTYYDASTGITSVQYFWGWAPQMYSRQTRCSKNYNLDSYPGLVPG